MSRRHKLGGWLLVLGVLALAAPAAAAAQLVAFAHPYRLSHSVTVVVQGAPDGRGGCTLPAGRLSLPPGRRAVELREDSLDTTTCEAIFERGIPPLHALKNAGGPDYRSAHSRRRHATASATYAYRAGYEQEWWSDPLGIVVNETVSRVAFHYDGGCVRSPVGWSAAWYWFIVSGWSLGTHDNRGGATCAQAYSSTYSHFHNGVFCAGEDVDTYYNRAVVYGAANGALSASWRSYNTGAWCKLLLGFNRALRRTA